MSLPTPRNHLTLGVWLLWTSAVYAAREVIVIGAGASGLAAARKLTNEGGVKVVVLEARPDRYGGRIWTNTADFTNVTGPEVDMGASFVHHPAPDNPVVQQLAELGIPILKLNESAILAVSDADGTRYDSHTIETALGTVYTALDDSMKNAKAQEKDESMESFLRKTNNSRLIASPLSQLLVAEVEFDYGAPLDEISAQMFDVGYGENNDADNFLPEKGYGQMVDMLVQRNSTDSRLDIRLGREVTAVTVLETRRVEVKCRDDSRYEADAVIVTVPLGVLKAGDIQFTPQLPLRKRDSIRRIGFGVINKLVLEFDRVFWPKDVYHLYAVLTNTTQRGDFTLIANLFPVTKSPILVFFAVSYFGKVSESLSDEELKTVAFARLRTIFGNVTNTVTVVNMARTRWLSDPFTRGAYSVPDIGVKGDDWDRIGEPLPPLFFAGEHTQTKYYATVQTALETGWRAANQTLQYFNASSAATKIRIPIALAITLIIVHSIESIKRRF